ncbi:MFS transporter [Virgibacillus sp.]|uniref:MFS transporter n=1 Tax=Virgibacillus sp. TaxID=1872700 RepID=UPI0018452C3C|nr:MFS transporter [Virgibacillus sp.]NWO12219.1 MFS transporter [Virgibacillus sp.]
MSHQPKIWTKDFISISLTQFLIFIAFYTLLTTLPIFVVQNLHGNEAEAGLVVTSMLIAAIIIRPFSALLLQKTGKKRGLILSVVMFVAITFLYMFIESFIPLLIVRFLHGLAFGVVTTATGAIAADIIPASRRGAGLGYFAMAMNLAVVVGPFIGLTVLQYTSFQQLFLLLSIIMLVTIIHATMIQIDETGVKPNVQEKQKWTVHDFIETRALPIAFICSLIALAYSSVMSFISVYSNVLGLTSTAGYFFVVFAAVMITSRPYLGRTFDVKGPKYVIIPCLFIFSLGLIALSITHSSWMLLTSAALIGLGFGTLLPSFQTMAVQAAPKHRSAHATSTFFILYDGGMALGSFVWGIIISYFGFSNLYLLNAVIVLAVILLFRYYLGKRTPFIHRKRERISS